MKLTLRSGKFQWYGTCDESRSEFLGLRRKNVSPLSLLFTVARADELMGNSLKRLKKSKNIFTLCCLITRNWFSEGENGQLQISREKDYWMGIIFFIVIPEFNVEN